VTIILGGDSLNKTFPIKEQDARNPFFSKNQIFKAAAISRCDKGQGCVKEKLFSQ
jgi:hypothetical protein